MRTPRRASRSPAAHFLARTGLTARGVIDAAVTHNASESGGIDKALLTLRNQQFGEFLMLAAALGPVAEGLSRHGGERRWWVGGVIASYWAYWVGPVA